MNPTLPRLLLVEDDPVSASFLHDAAASLPARVDVAAGIAEALAMATEGRPHDLYLIDANLPDGRGETLLQRLRGHGLAAPALAHTAARDAGMGERLLEAGFVEVLGKPLGVEELHDALRHRLGLPPPAPDRRPDWDDGAALAALGQRAHVEAMRGLFLQELPAQRERIHAAVATSDQAAIRAELHRLAASCGFVGAARLADAVRMLQDSPLDPSGLQRFDAAAEELLLPEKGPE